MTGKQLKAIRNRLGNSQTELAKRLGVAFITINRWENGHRAIPTAVSLALKFLTETR